MDMLGRRDHGHAGEEGWSIRYVIKGILARKEAGEELSSRGLGRGRGGWGWGGGI